MARSKQVRFSKKVKKFILNKMAEGNDISQIVEKWPDQVPTQDSIYRKSVNDKEFAEDVNNAYGILLMHRLDELHRISGMTASQAYPDVEDWRQAEAALKRKIDEAKFVLGKMAPVLSRRFEKTEKIKIDADSSGPRIAVINYYAQEDSQNEAIESIAHQVKTQSLTKQGPKEEE